MQMSYSTKTADREALSNMVYPATTIKSALFSMTAEMRERLQDANNILYVCLMDGAVQFFVAATSLLPLGYCEYFKVSSYHGQEQGEVVISQLSDDARSRKYDAVIIFDDICDSGSTFEAVKSYIQGAIPNTPVYTAALIVRDTPARKHTPDFIGIETSDSFFFYGFGMDLDGFGRNADFITK